MSLGVAVMVKVDEAATVGVPLIVSPVSVRPVGSAPLVRANVCGAVPPVTESVCV